MSLQGMRLEMTKSMASSFRTQLLRFSSSRKSSARRKHLRVNSRASLSPIKATPSSLTSAKKIFQAFLATSVESCLARWFLCLACPLGFDCPRGSGLSPDSSRLNAGASPSLFRSDFCPGADDFPFPRLRRLLCLGCCWPASFSSGLDCFSSASDAACGAGLPDCLLSWLSASGAASFLDARFATLRAILFDTRRGSGFWGFGLVGSSE